MPYLTILAVTRHKTRLWFLANKCEIRRKEAVVAYFEAIYHHVFGETYLNRADRRNAVSGPRLEPKNVQIRSKSVNQWTATLCHNHFEESLNDKGTRLRRNFRLFWSHR
jgi:hypothetical protein